MSDIGLYFCLQCYIFVTKDFMTKDLDVGNTIKFNNIKFTKEFWMNLCLY